MTPPDTLRDAPDTAPKTPSAGNTRIAIAAGCVGNFLEFYNFLVYVFFAPMIGEAFFPSQDELARLLSALLAFGAGFLARPLGAIVFGAATRRIGNGPVLMITLSLMAAGSLILALCPTHASIGIAAPILIITARLLQGFSEGGEVGPATDFLFSLGQGRDAGLLGAMQAVTQTFASLVAVLLGLALSLTLSHTRLYTWGWRIPILAGLAVVPFGIVLRRMAITTHPAASTPKTPDSRVNPLNLALIFLTITSSTITTYVRTFGVSYAISVLHLPTTTAMAGSAIGMAIALAIALLSLTYIRKTHPLQILIPATLANIITLYPCYALAISHPSLATQTLLNTCLFTFSTLALLATYSIMLHTLPNHTRAAIFGIAYTIAVSVFGGATTPALTWLIHQTHTPMTPAYVSLIAIPLGLAATTLLARRAPTPL